MALSGMVRRLLKAAMANGSAAGEIADAIDANTPGGATITASVAEINRLKASTRVVAVGVSATTYAVTSSLAGGRTILVNTTVPIAITLPAATGSFEEYKFRLSVAATATGHTIKVANTLDAMAGVSIITQTDTAQVCGFKCTATDDTITLNGTTKGGIVGDLIIIQDVAAAKFQVTILGAATGTVATPFSATV